MLETMLSEAFPVSFRRRESFRPLEEIVGEQDGPDAVFRAGLAEGRVRIQKCGACDRHIFFPRVLCPHCGGTTLNWVEVSGKGTVYTATTVRQKPERGGDYNISMIDLAEGVRMMSRVEGIDPADVRIGMPVSAYVGNIDGTPGVLFKPAKV